MASNHKLMIVLSMSLMIISTTIIPSATSQSTEDSVNLRTFNVNDNNHQLRHHNYNEKWSDVNNNKNVKNTNNNNNNNMWKYENFLLLDNLSDGEFERRISYNGMIGKQTKVAKMSDSLSLWQLANNHIFLQVIYSSNNEIIDCEYVRQKQFINDFVTKFHQEINVARQRNFTSPASLTGYNHHHELPHVTKHEFREFVDNDIKPITYKTAFDDDDEFNDVTDAIQDDIFGLRNLTYTELQSDKDIPDDLKILLDYKTIKQQCDLKHEEMKKIVHDLSSKDENSKKNATEHLERRKRALSDIFLAPNTKWCGKGNAAATYNQLGGASRADMCCRKHDHCKLNIHAMTAKWHLFNYRPFTISHCNCDRRQRRDLSNLLIVPGTKWCGKGWSATKYSDMGGHSKADRCCRQHDKFCPFWIMGFETKYGFFNWRVNTLMHCKCDERFRTCLKMADSPDANMVGKLFFNIVQTKCFVLKPEKFCKHRTWWGECTKKGLRKRAHLRDNRKF